ncbi:hypothetical protein CVIRNUC_005242 [Coccomyxa viridis]|uniref:CHCH domain-containing protein n=1 Tax=Coccomyxa viridis TaxID=1274662 RepID=A0AAV1I4R1_9CHLO|nr:hypothetical protein CVIRNUC_005242 [Coccomyxa viridis]
MDDGWQYSSHGSITFLAPHMQPETSNKAPSISKEHAAEEEDDPFLNQQGCGKAYGQLEECLADNDRDWRACQRELQAWKRCYQKAQKSKDKPEQ